MDLSGVVCETCAASPSTLVLGNQLMLRKDPSYPMTASQKYKVPAHTIDAVANVVAGLEPPPSVWMKNVPQGINTAADVFAGYLMLDAWIANQDRHHENWAAVTVGGLDCLSPTFDHGASMARNLTNEERHDRLTSLDVGRQIGHFARRARSAFYHDVTATRPMKTVEAWQAFSLSAPKASMIWQQRLALIQDSAVQDLLKEIPPSRISGVGRDFTSQLLIENRRRILEGENV